MIIEFIMWCLVMSVGMSAIIIFPRIEPDKTLRKLYTVYVIVMMIIGTLINQPWRIVF